MDATPATERQKAVKNTKKREKRRQVLNTNVLKKVQIGETNFRDTNEHTA